MKITRFKRIKDHRVFRDFTWPIALDDFRRYNLIYGWNGSGKTSMSTLFRHLQERQPVPAPAIATYICGGTDIDSRTLNSMSAVPDVRVFNRDFVAATVLASTGIRPIFFLGKESVEKQRQVEEFRVALGKAKIDLLQKEGTKGAATSNLDEYAVEKGKAVKLLLSSGGGNNPYNNYDKRTFRQRADVLKNIDHSVKFLDDAKKQALKLTIASSPKDEISLLASTIPDAEPLRLKIETILARTVLSSVLDELSKDGQIADWVRDGLGLHTGYRATPNCRFCGQAMSASRLTALEGHFNDEYKRFLSEIDTLISEVDQALRAREVVELPDKAKLYDALAPTYLRATGELQTYLNEASKYFGALKRVLLEKKKLPFESIDLVGHLIGVAWPGTADGVTKIDAINAIISQHNDQTNTFQKTTTAGRKALEECLVAEAMTEFKKKEEAITVAESEATTARAEKVRLEKAIADLEQEIIEHRQPAEELNAELCSYLGRDELKFEVRNTGYSVIRGGVPATDLSEGERTAVAFLYFLKSLNDKDFNLAEGVVVIDDPISSLDTNALFSAFGFMKERTQEAGQLFVLTHSFAFFRQVKNWFRHIKNKKQEVRFYMLESDYIGTARNAALRPLDPLLIDYESEYHYLFDRIYKKSMTLAGGPLEGHYHIPNMARRLLESFLSFRFPNDSGELNKQLEKTKATTAKQARIIRFLHTYSHDGKISDPEHDLSVLAETPAILRDVLELIKNEDPAHYAEMEALVGVFAAASAIAALPVVPAPPTMA